MTPKKIIAWIIIVIGVAGILIFIADLAAAQDREPCRIQRVLQQKGFYPGPIDCVIGDDTKKAIRRFQRDRGLYVDGIVGEDTYKALFGFFRNEEDVATKLPPSPDDDDGEVSRTGSGADFEEFGYRCKDTTLRVAGGARSSIDGWLPGSSALISALKKWQVEASALHGEIYSNWSAARKVGDGTNGPGVVCTNAHRLLGKQLYRCIVTGKPCKPKGL